MRQIITTTLTILCISACAAPRPAPTIQVPFDLAAAPPVDNTVPDGGSQFDRIMVLPPKENAATTDDDLAQFERLLLGAGVAVVSPAITGRAIIAGEGSDRRESASAAPLSDLERALILAKASNVKGLLEIQLLRWMPRSTWYRHTNGRFERSTAPPRADELWVELVDVVFWVRARLIDVESGEIKLALDVSQGTAQVRDIHQLLRPSSPGSRFRVDILDPEPRKLLVRDAVAAVLKARLVPARLGAP